MASSGQKTLRPYSTQNRYNQILHRGSQSRGAQQVNYRTDLLGSANRSSNKKFSAYRGSDLSYFQNVRNQDSYKRLLKAPSNLIRPNSTYIQKGNRQQRNQNDQLSISEVLLHNLQAQMMKEENLKAKEEAYT